jgi:hypothetical protein
MLILAAIHIPLPQADYHNIRHHDAPGEICPYHDHLLRWHPAAASADDVTLLHWHWFVPVVDPGARPAGADDEQAAPRPGPALHAHLGDWPEPDWSGEPVIRPDDRGRFLEHLTLGLSAASSAYLSGQVIPANLQSGSSTYPPGGPSGAHPARVALFQRWNC